MVVKTIPHLLIASASGIVLGFAAALSITAQPQSASPGVTQQFLLSGAPLAQFPGKVITVFTGDFQPGAQTPLHRHPATELLYVLQGNGVMHIQGRESRELAPGGVVLVEPEAGQDSFVHQAVNLSKTDTMKTLVVVIHDQGSPPAALVSGQR
jgi:quercetin dioxygenase-like cupin family protein